MRQSRRGCFYQGKSNQYVWAIYNLSSGVVGGSAGSTTLNPNSARMASTSYTVSSDGTFTLTNPTTVWAYDLQAGMYIVNSSYNTSYPYPTSGTTLYKIVSTNNYNTIDYIPYTISEVKGTDTGNRAKSETLDYPINGIHGNYWYVLIESPVQYIWDVYDVSYALGTGRSGTVENPTFTTYVNASKSFTYEPPSFVGGSGRFTLTSPQSMQLKNTMGYYIVSTDSSTAVSSSILYEVTSINTSGGIYGWGTPSIGYTYYSSATAEKGDNLLNKVSSDNLNEYPMNGLKGNYWYVMIYAGSPESSKYVWNVYTLSNNAAGDFLLSVGSNTSDYPVNGASGDLWYTMVKGEYPVYVWNVYNKQASGYKIATTKDYTLFHNGTTGTVYSSYSLDKNTGKVTGSGASSTYEIVIWDPGAGNIQYEGVPLGKYEILGGGTYAWYFTSANLNSDRTYVQVFYTKYEAVQDYIKSTATNTTVESQDSSAYPANGYIDDNSYWYVYSHAYSVSFDNT